MLKNTPDRISDTEAQRILNMIEDGTLKVGDKLPGQRELASQLGIGRSSIREAIRSLEAVGVLKTRPGLGTYVVSAQPYALVASSIASWLADHREEVIKVFEVREAIETKAAELAAANISSSQIREMKAAIEKMDACSRSSDIEGLAMADYEFHDLISRAAQNDLLYKLIDDIQHSLLKSRRAILTLPGRADQSVAEHYLILDALKLHDPLKAKESMRLHLKSALSEVDED